MNSIKQCNKELDKLQYALLEQLKTTNIEYIDLYSYANKVDSLKLKKNSLFLSSF